MKRPATENGRLFITALLSAALLTPGAARAQATPDAAPEPGLASEPTEGVSDVNAAVKRGIELRRAGKDEEALQVFREALARAPGSNRIRVHLAATHQALGQWVEAEHSLREAMQHLDDPYIVRHLDALERSLDYVNARLGRLEVRGTPAGADVFLSGERLGTLPLDARLVPTGFYELEVRKPGYYPALRSLSIASRGLLRERVDLTPSGEPSAPSSVPVRPAPTQDSRARSGFPWLATTLAGVGAVGALTAGVAWAMRESYASRWNSADCLADQRTRRDNCGSYLDSGRTAERVAIGSGVGAVLFLGGAATVWLSTNSDGPDDVASGCAIGVGDVSCVGSF